MRTRSLCPICLRLIDAKYDIQGKDVFLDKTCPEHGHFATKIWSNSDKLPDFATWQKDLRLPSYPNNPSTAINKGCPFDCGLCPEHGQKTCTALVEVSQNCSLACPVCYAKSTENKRISTSNNSSTSKEPTLAEIETIFANLAINASGCNLQISGGEPTEREDLPEIIQLASKFKFGIIQLNTNGLLLANDLNYALKLKEAGLDSVYLQYDAPTSSKYSQDGQSDAIYQKLRGRNLTKIKEKALQNCLKANLAVVLVATLVKGVNEHILGILLEEAVNLGVNVRGLHLQPAASFGRYFWQDRLNTRLTLADVMLLLEEQTAGKILARHFHPPSCEHPLCSFSAVYARTQTGLSAEPIGQASCCSNNQALEQAKILDNAEGSRKSRAFIARHWTNYTQAEQEQIETNKANSLNNLNDAFSRFVANSGADKRFTISAMAFQDAWNFDLARIRMCCIHIATKSGNLMPFCAYNLTAANGLNLYRQN